MKILLQNAVRQALWSLWSHAIVQNVQCRRCITLIVVGVWDQWCLELRVYTAFRTQTANTVMDRVHIMVAF